MRQALLILGFASGLLVACADFPDLDHVVSERARSAAFPGLAPLEGELGPSAEDRERIENTAKTLAAQARNLKRRARQLRKPVIDRGTRAKMAAAVRRHYVAGSG